MNRVFISYRRDDTRWVARALKTKLAQEIGEEQVFMDIDSIDPGVDFVEVLERTVANVDVLIAVIGQDFFAVKDSQGGRRIDNPNDFVRLEIATALKRNIRVIPLVVSGATIPTEDDLPDDLKSLARRNAIQVGETTFDSDVDRIVKSLNRLWENKDTGDKKPGNVKPVAAPATAPKKDSHVRKSNRWALPVGVGLGLLAIAGLLFAFSGIWNPQSTVKKESNDQSKQDIRKADEDNSNQNAPSEILNETDDQEGVQQVVREIPDVEGMAWIPNGTFEMGSPESELGRKSDETLHEVTISDGFYLGEFEITQEQYNQVMKKDVQQVPACLL